MTTTSGPAAGRRATADGDYMVPPGSEAGIALGFTADRFYGWLWRKPNDVIYVSFIESKQPGQGHLRELFKTLWAQGLTIKVPTPMGNMRHILRRYGFEETECSEDLDFGEGVEVWRRGP